MTKGIKDLLLERQKSIVNVNGKAVFMDLEKMEGKAAEKNGTHGQWAIDEPTDNDVYDFVDKSSMDRNTRLLLQKFKGEEPFFIQGKAGWGKTQVIKKMAKKFKRSIITVYLDKAEATDLGGIPIPQETKSKKALTQEMAMPGWATYMYEHPDQDFLLFFDEMNQAAPDVMNALMPIVLENVICNYKFDNFMVGAAGNFEDENIGGISELSAPLAQRFKPIIIWESDTEESWNTAYKFLRKEWSGKIPEKIIDAFDEHKMLFDSPRLLEHKVFKWISKVSRYTDNEETMDVEDVSARLEDLLLPDVKSSRSDMDSVQKLAELVYEYLISPESFGANSTENKRRSKTANNLNKDLLQLLIDAAEDGVIVSSYQKGGKTKHYNLLVTKENAPEILLEEGVSIMEEANQYINAVPKWRFETNKEALKYRDNIPNTSKDSLDKGIRKGDVVVMKDE